MYNPEISAQLHRQRYMELANIERQIRSIEKEKSADRSEGRVWISRLRALFTTQTPDRNNREVFTKKQLQAH